MRGLALYLMDRLWLFVLLLPIAALTAEDGGWMAAIIMAGFFWVAYRGGRHLELVASREMIAEERAQLRRDAVAAFAFARAVRDRGVTFDQDTNGLGEEFIMCRICLLTSYNLNDISHSFCPNCRLSHNQVREAIVLSAQGMREPLLEIAKGLDEDLRKRLFGIAGIEPEVEAVEEGNPT